MRTILYFYCLLLWSQMSFAQVFQTMEIPFISGNGESLSLAGGLNSPQFSKVDLNDDGIEDLYVFDRANNVHLPFLISEENGALKYTYDYSYARNFPHCKFWVALRDYNNDGIADLFTFDAESQVYKGKYVDGKIAFDKVALSQGAYEYFLTFNGLSGSKDFIPLFQDDYPVIEDIDGDGDFDILVFGGESSVNYFQNQAVEKGYSLDSLTFTLADDCWGRFARNDDNEVELSDDINVCASGFAGNVVNDRFHMTLTLMVYDEDQDGDMEAIVGSATSSGFTKLTNNGPPGLDFMTEAFPSFPDYDVPIDIQANPNAFYLDIDNNGVAEFVASPNQIANGEDIESVWLYKNIGIAGETIWEQQQTDWLVEDMVDLGSNSAPAFIDYNADGLTDIVAGTGGVWLWTNKGSLTLFENTGTDTEPAYTLVEEDWLGFSSFNETYSNFTPAFGDLDNDGDEDLLVGTDSGELIFVENEAGDGNPVQFNEDNIIIGWKNILVGRKTVPQIADLNRDGLTDLLIGERAGNVNYMPNIGSIGDPQFEAIHELPPNNEFFGEISTAGAGVSGNATPRLLDRGSHFFLVVGSGSAGLKFFEFTENDLENIIPPMNNDWGGLRTGDNLYPAIADLNGDGFMELILGSRRGGLTVFGTQLGVTFSSEQKNNFDLSVFPNPVNQELQVHFSGFVPEGINFFIYNNLGQLVKKENSNLFSVAELPSGVYFLEAVKKGQISAVKFVKD